jgi:hypothetical protein
MIPKSGVRFSDQDHAKLNSLRALPAFLYPSPVEAPHGPVVVPVSMMPGAARAQQ